MQTSTIAVATAAPMMDVRIPDKGLIEERLRGIIDRLQQQADDQVRLKAPIEQRWLRNLRQFHGRYDPTLESELRDAKKSRAFIKITRKKTNSWKGRLESLVFPTDDRNYAIQPTPVPSLGTSAQNVVEEAMKLIEQANAQQEQAAAAAAAGDQQGADMAGQQAQQIAGAAADLGQQSRKLAEEIKEAKKRAEAMQQQMDDQLVECDYPMLGRDAIHYLCQLGTGIIKGPMVSGTMRGQWEPGPAGFEYKRSPDPRPIFRCVNPWSYFPEMAATRKGEEEFEYERHIWSRKDLRDGVRDSGFNPTAVRRLLDDGVKERSLVDVGMTYLAELRDMTGTTETIKNRYIGWEYHGYLECDEIATMLHALGKHEEALQYEANPDPLAEMKVIAYFCNTELLKIAPEYPLDSQESLYSLVAFEQSEGSMFGYGIPEIMQNSQDAMNAAWRMCMDNAGLSTGPQIVIDKDAITPANRQWELTARKIWYRNKNAAANSTPFEAIDIPNNVAEIMAIVQTARAFADDETALPVQSEGEMTDNPNVTATASNIMALGFNVTFRSVVKAWDDGITVPCMRRLYDWNMQFNKREDIKGDMSVDARGSSVLLVREVQSQIMMAIVSNHTTHPTIALMIDPYEAYKKFLQSMMIPPDEIMVSKEEYEKRVDAAAQNPDSSPDVITAQSRIEVAKIQAASRKASDDAMLQAEEKRFQTAMIQLAEQRNMHLDELTAMLQVKAMDADTKTRTVEMQSTAKERQMAAELGWEERNAMRAQAEGKEPTGSGGYVSAGVDQ